MRKNLGILYSPNATYIPSLKFEQLSSLEISCLQGFETLTTDDLWPPWKTIGIIYSLRGTYIPIWSSCNFCFLRCLQAEASHTHTDTHTPSPSHRFLRPSTRNQKLLKGHRFCMCENKIQCAAYSQIRALSMYPAEIYI